MSINNARFQRYLKELEGLQADVQDDRFIRIFEEKFLDLLFRKQLDLGEIPEITQELNTLFGVEFATWESNVLGTYDHVLDLVNTEYDDIGPIMLRQIQEVRSIEHTNQMQLGEYEEATKLAIKEKVKEGIKEEWSYNQLSDEIKKINKRAAFYSDTLAATHLKRYARNLKNQKALVAGINIFLYAGVLRPDKIRPFCLHCLDKLFHIDDINRMRNGNMEPVRDNCGGWNCIHEWEPDPTAERADAISGEIFPMAGGARVVAESEPVLEEG